MNDHIKSEISTYLSGELPESRNRQIEAHAAACDKCRNALAKMRAKLARIKREALKKATQDMTPNLFWNTHGKPEVAASFLSTKFLLAVGILAVVGGGYWYRRSHLTPMFGPVAGPAASAPVAKADDAPPPPKAAAKSAPKAPPAAPAAPKVEAPKPPLVLHVFQDWKGADSSIVDSRLVVVRDEATLGKLWTEMQAKDSVPAVDFSQQIILGIFAGEQPAGTAIILGRIEESDGEMIAPYRILPGTVQIPAAPVSSAPTIAPPGPTHPYLLALVSRVSKKIRIVQKEKSS